jgi:hypothetical protein
VETRTSEVVNKDGLHPSLINSALSGLCKYQLNSSKSYFL